MRTTRPLAALSIVFLFACTPTQQTADPTGVEAPPSLQEDTPSTPAQPPPETPPPATPPPESPPPEPEAQRPFVMPSVQPSVPEYELLLPPGVLELFLADKNTEEQDATFRCAGVSYAVKVRLRGASARDFPKKSWNVKFVDARFEGRKSLNLVAEYADATLLAEKLAYDMLEALRVPAPHAKYARLRLNGHDEGVFLDIEQVDKSFLSAHAFADDDASIYRAGWKDTELKLRSWKVPYQGDWVKKTNEKENDTALDAVLEVINRSPEPSLPTALAQHLELESYLRSMVMDALMANNYVEDSESYFIHDHETDRWAYVPWDLNNVDARWWYQLPLDADLVPIYRQPLFPFTLTTSEVAKRYAERKTIHPGYLPVFSNLGTRVVMNPELRTRLLTRLDKALAELFTVEVMGAHIDALHALIAPYMAKDPYMDFAKFQAGRAFMRNFVRLRRAFVLQELERFRNPKAGLVLEALDARAGWVELRNRGTQPVPLGGLVLTTNLRRSIPELLDKTADGTPVGTLPPRTLAPGERVRFSAAALGLTFAAEGEVGVFDGQSVVGVKDALFYGKLPDGQHYERADDTAGAWRVR